DRHRVGARRERRRLPDGGGDRRLVRLPDADRAPEQYAHPRAGRIPLRRLLAARAAAGAAGDRGGGAAAAGRLATVGPTARAAPGGAAPIIGGRATTEDARCRTRMSIPPPRLATTRARATRGCSSCRWPRSAAAAS